jgi:RNA polymerase sigma-70 factor (ECF subfamily)
MSHKDRFPTTQWNLVLTAGEGTSEESREALASLCRTYWYPLYGFVRRQGYPPEEAQDLTQGFFAQLLEKRYLRQYQRERGRFRSFLLASLKHFLANQRDWAFAQKRGAALLRCPWTP